jgi:hypothetical protein
MSKSPPWLWVRIVLASEALSAGEKLLYSEIRGLNELPRGCTKGAADLAARLGVHPQTVKVQREALVALGLLLKQDRGAGRAAGWFVTLPRQYLPDQRVKVLSDDDVQYLASRLSAHVRQLRGQSGSAPPTTSSSPSATTPPLNNGSNGEAETTTVVVPRRPVVPPKPQRHRALPDTLDVRRGKRGNRRKESTPSIREGSDLEREQVREVGREITPELTDRLDREDDDLGL